MPRFTIRTALIVTAAVALFFAVFTGQFYVDAKSVWLAYSAWVTSIPVPYFGVFAAIFVWIVDVAWLTLREIDTL
jgi:hypothetical protein